MPTSPLVPSACVGSSDFAALATATPQIASIQGSALLALVRAGDSQDPRRHRIADCLRGEAKAPAALERETCVGDRR